MERCGFFDANLVGEEYDRVYLASQFAAYFASFIGNGVFAQHSNQLQVMEMATPQMQIGVERGQAWINGYWYENTDMLYLPIDVADGVLNRIDSVVLRLGFSERNIWLTVKKGTPAINPIAPEVTRTADYYELQLATISIPAGSIKITQSQITDTRMNQDVCGWVTGVIDQLDTTTLFNQYVDWYTTITEQAEQDWNDWFSQQQTEGFVMAVEKGQPNGIATLDENGKVPDEQLPDDLADYAQHGVTMGSENDIYVAKIGSLFEFTPLEANYGGNIYAIATDDEFVYVGGTIPQTVKKLNKSDLSQVAVSASYGGTIHAIATDDEFVYVGGHTTQTVRKLRKSDLSQVAVSASYGGTIEAIATDDEYVYVGGRTTQTVRKLRKSDLSQVAESANYGGNIYTIATDDEFVYVGGETTQTVRKLRKSDLSQVAESANYGGIIDAIAIDDEFVYIGGWATRTVRKLRKRDLSQVAESADYGGEILAIATDDEFVYVGGATTRTVRKLRKIDLSRVAVSASYGGDIYAIAADDEFVYVGGQTTRNVRVIENRDLIKIIRRYQ